MSELTNLKRRSKIGRWVAFMIVLTLLGSYGMMTLRKNVSSDELRKVEGYTEWSDDVVKASRNLAFQDGGRIKPFSTWAGFNMLELYGTRKMKITVNDEKVVLKPEQVILDCLFRPELARELPLFRVDNSDVISSLGSSNIPADVREMLGMSELAQKDVVASVLEGKGKRDRYSFNELEPIMDVLFSKMKKIREGQAEKTGMAAAEMTAEQRRTIVLSEQVLLFLNLAFYFDFARADIRVEEGTPSARRLELERMSYWIKSFPVLAQAVRKMNPEGEELPPALKILFHDLEVRMERSKNGVYFIPPYTEGEDEWTAVGQRVNKIINGDLKHSAALVADMVLLENATIALRDNDQSAFAKELTVFKESVHQRISERQVKQLNSEVFYAKANYFLNALVIFLFATLVVMFSWLAPQSLASRILSWVASFLAVTALVLMVAGITHRCMIMERSPIGNLYDTILFIGMTGVLVLLLVELMTRRMVALGLAVFMGLACMFLARRYEVGDGSDHMDPLVAVLKSNFWLSTHVVTVIIGYMGGLAAAGLSVVYIFARVLGIDEGDKDFRRSMTRIAYGMVCFTLFFSLIGTVLGGIWANDSWGRFWGWDPKENGALMIVLWCLAVLHARLAGYLKEWGIHIAAVFGANIVAFSWWHVNSLSTGLHSYGFIEGIGAIWGFYYLMTGVCIIAGIAALITNRSSKKRV